MEFKSETVQCRSCLKTSQDQDSRVRELQMGKNLHCLGLVLFGFRNC